MIKKIISHRESSLVEAGMKVGTFVLGVGCQKGGTSWLHSQLTKSDGFDAGFRKEYHVFDAVYNLRQIGKVENINSVVSFDDIVADPDLAITSPQKENSILAMFRSDTNTYFNYFKLLLERSESVVATGDITPLYAGLPDYAFKHIREQFVARGVSTKVVFIMRDPVERVWSQVRMRCRNYPQGNRQTAVDKTEEESVLERYRMQGVMLRTQYEKTIRNIEAVFNKDEILYILYEDLFTNVTRRSIEVFLGLEFNSYDVNSRVNESPKTKPLLNKEVAMRVANHYRDTYLFCDSMFDVRDKWSGFDFL